MTSSLGAPSIITCTIQPGPSGTLCRCSAPTPLSHTNILSSFRSRCDASFGSFPTLLCFGCSSTPPIPSSFPDSLRALQWNAGGFRVRSAKLLHFISLHPVNLICIQESNLNSSSSFQNPEYSALRLDRTHSRPGILSPADSHACGSVIIFAKQGQSFFALTLSLLSIRLALLF